MSSGAAKSPWPDRLLAAALAALSFDFAAHAVFNRPEWFDTLTYALPAANLVSFGKLALPQLGTQMGFDRFWLFNSALMGAGPAPLFAAFGIGRGPELAGLLAIAAFNLLVALWVFRRAAGGRAWPWAWAALLACAALGHRGYFGELYNQKYSALAFGAMWLTLFPAGARSAREVPAWQWAAAGTLPIIHPGLLPAWAAWAAWRGLGLLCEIPRNPGAEARRVRIGPSLFVALSFAGLAWYARPEALHAQFLPHLRFNGFRRDGHFYGLFGISASFVAALPSRMLAALAVTGACAALVDRAARAWRDGSRSAAPSPLARAWSDPVLFASALMLVMTAWDGARGFEYMSYYELGFVPVLLVWARGTRWRKTVPAALAAIACANLAVSSRLDLRPMAHGSEREAVRFVVEHTRPGDRIVVGPPFVLAAAERAWPEGRRIAYAVPETYFLDDFDVSRFRTDLALGSDVYVGDPEWFERQEIVEKATPAGTNHAPIYPLAEKSRLDYLGEPVLVARKPLLAPPGRKAIGGTAH